MAHLSYADEFPRGRAPAPSGSPLLAAALACVASFTVVYSYLAAQPRAVDLWTAAPVRVAPHVRTAPMAPPPHVTGGQASAHVHREAQAPPAPVPGPWAARYEALNAKTAQWIGAPLSLLLLPLTALTAVLMVIRQATARPVRPAPLAMAAVTGTARRGLKNKKLLVLGGSGYLGSRICRAAVEAGYKVTALSRRGGPPKMDPALEQVEWRIGDATEAATLQGLVNEGYDCIVHAIGLLFDSQSGLANLNTIVSGSQSLPDANGTYDRITRQTAEDLIDAVLEATPANTQLPLAFISAAEAGWPDVPGGPLMDKIVPDFLKRYLIAKRVVEGRLTADNDGKIRPLILRPSLMWDWGKLDVLPAIPVFWAASKAGVPFVDRPVQVNTIAKAVVEGLDNDDVQGVIRFEKMDELAARNQWEF